MKHILTLTTMLMVCTIVFGQEKTISKTYNNVKNIRLSTASGDITLKKSGSSDIKLLIKYTYNDGEFKPVLEQNGDRLRLEEQFSDGNHSGNSIWTLEVPDNITVSMNTGSGDIIIDKISLNLKSNTGSGDVSLTASKGEIDLNTGSGDINFEQVDGDISLNTGSGTVTATSGTGIFSINAGSGDIRLNDLKGEFSINTGSGDIRSKGLAVNGSSRFNTGSGSANVVLAAPLDHNISVNSGSGDATLNFSGNAISGEVIMTANKRSGSIVAPFPFDKEETIEKDGNQARVQKTAKLGSKNIIIKVGTGTGTAEIVK